MNLPQRDKNHLICSQAEKLFCQQIPENWIIRDLAREDYGIDYYIEVVDKDHHVTGDTFLVQLKGKESICFNKAGKHGTQLKTSTLNYWISLKVPVFLFVADVTTKKMYQTSVKSIIRSNYEKISKQGKFSIHVYSDNLFTGDGIKRFILDLNLELHSEADMLHFQSFIMQYDGHFDFLAESIGNDLFLPVEPQDLSRLFHLVVLTQSMCRLAGEPSCLLGKVIQASLEKDRAAFQDDEYMHEMTRDTIASYILIVWAMLLPGLLTRLKKEEDYWGSGKVISGHALFLDFDYLKRGLLDRLKRDRAAMQPCNIKEKAVN